MTAAIQLRGVATRSSLTAAIQLRGVATRSSLTAAITADSSKNQVKFDSGNPASEAVCRSSLTAALSQPGQKLGYPVYNVNVHNL